MKLQDLVRGDTRRFTIVFPTDITGATGKMTWRTTEAVADPGSLQIEGALGGPGLDGLIYSIKFDLLKEDSAALSIGTYYPDFEITRASGTNVKTIKTKIRLTSGGG